MYLFCDTKCRAAEVPLQVQVVLGVEIRLESQEPSHQTAPGGVLQEMRSYKPLQTEAEYAFYSDHL